MKKNLRIFNSFEDVLKGQKGFVGEKVRWGFQENDIHALAFSSFGFFITCFFVAFVGFSWNLDFNVVIVAWVHCHRLEK